MDEGQKFDEVLSSDITYLEKTEKLLYSRLWGYIIGENWSAVCQVVGVLRSLSIV